jgi:hypothetical protein
LGLVELLVHQVEILVVMEVFHYLTLLLAQVVAVVRLGAIQIKQAKMVGLAVVAEAVELAQEMLPEQVTPHLLHPHRELMVGLAIQAQIMVVVAEEVQVKLALLEQIMAAKVVMEQLLLSAVLA